MGISHDHGLDLKSGYVVISSPFKSHSQVNEYEVMTLGQHDPIFY